MAAVRAVHGQTASATQNTAGLACTLSLSGYPLLCVLLLQSDAHIMQKAVDQEASPAAPDPELQRKLDLMQRDLDLAVNRYTRGEIALAGARAEFEDQLARCVHNVAA